MVLARSEMAKAERVSFIVEIGDGIFVRRLCFKRLELGRGGCWRMMETLSEGSRPIFIPVKCTMVHRCGLRVDSTDSSNKVSSSSLLPEYEAGYSRFMLCTASFGSGIGSRTFDVDASLSRTTAPVRSRWVVFISLTVAFLQAAIPA